MYSLIDVPLNLYKLLRNSKFVQDFSIVLSGATAAQVITLLCTPILTRLYTTEQFGMLGIFMAIASVLSVISTGRMDMAIMLPKEDSSSINLLFVAIVIAIFISLLSCLLIPAGRIISALLDAPELQQYIFMIPIYIFLVGLKDVLEMWSSRKKYFLLISIALILGAVASNGWRVILGTYGPNAFHLIFGAILLVLASLLALASLNLNELVENLRKHLSRSSIWKQLSKYSFLIKFRASKDFLNSVSQNLPAILLAYFFSPNQVGLYLLADRILRLPSVVIGKSIQKVFYQKATEIYNDGKVLTRPILQTTLGLISIGILPFLVIFIFGPDLFKFVFGEDWYVAGKYARWISIWMFVGFINIPSVTSIPILGLEKFFLKYELVSIIARLIGLLYGGLILQDDLLTVIVFSVIGAVLNVFIIFYVSNKAKYSIKNAIK